MHKSFKLKAVDPEGFGEPVLIIFHEDPLINLWMQPSAACCHGDEGLVTLRWQSASWSFFLKVTQGLLF